MNEEIKNLSNDPITTLSDQLRAHLEAPIEDLPVLLPHLINLGYQSQASIKALTPVNVQMISTNSEDETEGQRIHTEGYPKSIEHPSMLPGYSIDVIAHSLQSWSQFRALAQLFMIESEMAMWVYVSMNQLGKVLPSDLDPKKDGAILGKTEIEMGNLIENGFIVTHFSNKNKNRAQEIIGL